MTGKVLDVLRVFVTAEQARETSVPKAVPACPIYAGTPSAKA
jgi:hypothetical protein